MMAATFPVALRGNDRVQLWADEQDIEQTALDQLRRIGDLPWLHGVRVMPDVHFGKGATVGSVIAMRDALSPAAVGVDIGCGVVALETSLTEHDLTDTDLRTIRAEVERRIPVGFNMHAEHPEHFSGRAADLMGLFLDLHPGAQDLSNRAYRQLGTLGGGNHFIELCIGSTGTVWLTLHSGSRAIGKNLADRHIEAAKGLVHNEGLVDADLAVFLRDTPHMDAYLRDLRWAQAYAAESRAAMMRTFADVVRSHFEDSLAVTFAEPINVHHNYVSEEIVDGAEMLVTRKGAIRARLGELALIPGSMGTGSYVVRGLGNPVSFESASHGAGRRMSRNQARKRFTTADLIAQTAGVESRKDEAIVDEIPAAYKDIHAVIDAQRDLVEVVDHLRTILCVKG